MEYEVKQGDLTVVKTGSVLVYNNSPTIITINGDYSIEIEYEDYEKNEEQDIKIKATDKGVKFVLVNFKNPLGTCVGHPLKIATRGETKIYFAFAVYQLGVAKILYFNVCEGK